MRLAYACACSLLACVLLWLHRQSSTHDPPPLPAVGCGTKSSTPAEAFAAMLAAGCRLLDTKDTNKSLRRLGGAVLATGARSSFFLVSKLVGEADEAAHRPERALALAKEALTEAGGAGGTATCSTRPTRLVACPF